jgi:peroxiredoxin Q/BCP
MSELSVGDMAPEFCLPETEGEEICLGDLRGDWAVLYFYPKDNTKGCTLEALEFTEAEPKFEEMGAKILGVSPDSLESHSKFKEKHGLTIDLLSDTDQEILEEYGVWQLKKMFGREFMGVVRSTFLIDPEGEIAHIWRKVRVKGHVKEVKEKLKELKKQKK